MTKKDEDKLLSSDYDGIQEYDNNLPNWWVYLFYITIAFSVVYTVYYHYVPGVSTSEQLALDMEALKAKRPAATTESMGESDLLQFASLDANKAKGKEIYTGKCAVCHGPEGGGLIGPNLTDKFWIHGGTISDVKKVVVNGVLDKGMLAWKGVISDEEINQVVGYVWSIRNTNVANGKAPQGDPVEQ